MSKKAAIFGIISGACTVVIWKGLIYPIGGNFAIFEIIPGFIIASLTIIIVTRLDPSTCATIENEFLKAEKLSTPEK